ncbi:4Fe-4S dicluster domain-containing protein [Nitrincola alkalisediminis]|uniref:4Fe-4S dicluster domain-containing protein n=1 Tax=Nitrincola alkalisediminis TaxID=1366656 RepID=UPI001874B81E|nr:4Fe-4S dicluster domain-containing protein [Nitrincola alkalisediminis]
MKPNSLIPMKVFTASSQDNARARQQAINALPPVLTLQDNLITYTSQGHLLILGPEDLIRLAAAQLSGLKSITLLAMGQVSSQSDEHLEKALAAVPELTSIYLPLESLTGWLGSYHLQLKSPQGDIVNPAKLYTGKDTFDMVLDLNLEPTLAAEMSPPGYFHIAADSDHLVQAIEEISSLVGEFEKPEYVQVNHDICAHSDRGKLGCTRCLDVCPADAITSHNRTDTHDFQISVDVHLCHGAGSCTTACPTGALTFAAPRPQSQLERLRHYLDSYRQAGGEHPAILIHAEHTDIDLESLPTHVLPVALEEAAGAGAEIWLALLVQGATYVAIAVDEETPPSLQRLLKDEIKLTGRLLTALGHPAQRLSLVDVAFLDTDLAELEDAVAPWRGMPEGPSYPYQGKRKTLNEALDRLYEQGDADDAIVTLPMGSPYGQVRVDVDACTLCMSCVAICPTSALHSGKDQSPRLSFLEGDCVQCGLCERACPEQAIQLEARFAPAAGIRGEPRVMKEEEPFHCISCGKAFATQSTIKKISQKLEAHPYFQGDAAKRLHMCEDCRVRDSYRELAADPEAQLRL